MENTMTNLSLTLIAHRGHSGEFPENTLISYQSAYDCGARFMELDVQFSQDKVPFLHHDVSLLKMTGVSQDIFEVNAKVLQTLSASYPARFGARFTKNTLTCLGEYLQWLQSHDQVKTFIEIKSESIQHFGLVECMQIILAKIEHWQLQQQIVIIAFDEEVLRYTQENSNLATGWVLSEWSKKAQKVTESLQVDYVFFSEELLPSTITDMWPGPWRWVLYNVDEPASAIKIANQGLQYLETNRIGDLMQDKTVAKMTINPV